MRANQAVSLVLLAASPALGIVCAQIPMGHGGAINLYNTDLAVLEAGDPRKDLPCTVTPVKPQMGFDLRFHSGYEVTVPLKELVGSENMLTIVFRAAPANQRDQYSYFVQRIHVPAIEEDARGDAYLTGGFVVGEGNYHIDFLMRDRSERVCSFYWDSEAELATKDRQMALSIAPNSIQREDGEQFKEEPPIQRIHEDPPLNVKVLINFAPQNALSATLQPMDTSALVWILRTISREPRIGKFSLIAFNMQEQRVIYRQEDSAKIDFPGLGDAIKSLNLGTIDLKRLGDKHGDTDFLSDLITKEVGNDKEHLDALIFAGPKVMLDANVPQDSLKQVGNVAFPVFYMNYNLNPQAIPWKDAISRAVRVLRGTEYTITKPRDLWFAVSEIVSRIVKSRNGKQTAAISSQ
jgi:hypothetical protein